MHGAPQLSPRARAAAPLLLLLGAAAAAIGQVAARDLHAAGAGAVPPAWSPPPTPKFVACGAPLGPCGASLPANVSCPKGAGWCASGHFCGTNQTTAEPSRCLPIPADCGRAGRPCCPSNTKAPHTSPEDLFTRKPYCNDGSLCFFFAPKRNLDNGDYFAAVKGAYGCTKAAPDCGTVGKSCCPFLYHISTNPAWNGSRVGCDDGRSGDIRSSAFCNFTGTWFVPGVDPSLSPGTPPGVCAANAPDCGKFGKSCCVITGGSTTSTLCGVLPSDFKPGGGFRPDAPRGYCADAKYDSAGPLTSLICRPCPPPKRELYNISADTHKFLLWQCS